MKAVGAMIPVIVCALGGAGFARAQTQDPPTPSTSPRPTGEDEFRLPDPEPWSFSLNLSTYVLPDGSGYVQPTATADKGLLHLEARYNYENLDTTSLWAGANFSAGEEFTVEFTPMLGGVFGRTEGIAPGYELTLNWKGFSLYSEGEYVFDTRDSSDSFLYTWTQLTYSPIPKFAAGFVVQRTRAYEADVDIQRGVIVGVTFDHWNANVCLFNPASGNQTLVLTVGFQF